MKYHIYSWSLWVNIMCKVLLSQMIVYSQTEFIWKGFESGQDILLVFEMDYGVMVNWFIRGPSQYKDVILPV